MKLDPIISEVRDYHGMPTLFINGKPDTGLMHWNRFPGEEDIRVFRDAGIHLFSFMGMLSIRKHPDDQNTSYSDGMAEVPELSHEMLDKTLSMIEKVDQEAMVLIRFRITTPVWWREQHPDSLIVCWNPQTKEYIPNAHATVCDPEWLKLVRKHVDETIEFLEEHWSHRILGYHTGFGCCAENAYNWGNALADFSPSQLKLFRSRMKQKYGTIEALDQAWKRSYKSFDELEFPDPEQFVSRALGDHHALLDPKTQRDCIDFTMHISETMADSVILQARMVKESLRKHGRRKVFGTFYAYVNHPSNTLSPMCCGHHAHERVLNCPDIDMICAPMAYPSRNAGGTAGSQVLPASITLHGKLYYAEEDNRYYLAHETKDRTAHTKEETRPQLLHNFLASWQTGSALWWMDLFGGGWYRDQWFAEELRPYQKFAEGQLDKRQSVADTAVFVSDQSKTLERAIPFVVSGQLVEGQLEEISAAGIIFDQYRLEDLPLLVKTDKLKQYKFAIVLNAHRISDELTKIINAELKKDNRTILWFYAPGYVKEEKWSADAVSAMTGITLVESNTRGTLMTETWLDGHRILFGVPRSMYPCLDCADPEAENLGWFTQGSNCTSEANITGGALTRKQFESWRSVWCCSPLLPSDVIQKIAGESGVHVFDKDGDQIFNAPQWFGIYAKYTGEHTIRFPEEVTLRDARTGKLVIQQKTELTLSMKRGDCMLYYKENNLSANSEEKENHR